MADANALLYLRARYYNPALGVFTTLDPAEGKVQQSMSLNRYGYVTGNVVNAVDPSGLFVMKTPAQWDNCRRRDNDCPTTIFSYDGVVAARKAIELADFVRSHGGLPSNYESSSGTSSARFISIALWYGGFPMTAPEGFPKDPTASEVSNEATGWFAECDGQNKILGNSVWRSHDGEQASPNIEGLTAYLMGKTSVSSEIPELNESNFVGQYSVSLVTLGKKAEAPISESDLNILGLGLIPFSSINSGDYMFIPSRPAHGLLVVGRGPLLRCNSDHLLPGNGVGGKILSGTFDVSPDDPDLITGVFASPYVSRVPYVVDLPGVQRGTARPFYCPAVIDKETPDQYFAGLWYWNFYRVPAQLTVGCKYQFNPPFSTSTPTCGS
jgi:RHS repeat-associated protein